MRAERGTRRTPVALRIVRASRVMLHVVQGLATTGLVFPLLGIPERRVLIRRWSRQLLRMLRVSTRIEGLPEGGLPGNLLIVANHVSWLDIFAVHAVRPSRFIAKSEVRRWPVLGQLVAGCGTLFVDRGRRRDAHRINEQARDALVAGDTIAIFPEGTTSDGRSVLPFRSSLLQPIVDARGHLQPVAIRYLEPGGAQSDAPAYVGETTFLDSFWQVLGERSLVVELTFGPRLTAHARHRGELARQAEAIIRRALEQSPRGSGPEIHGHRRASPR
jgi:1-acyl-sn-glycerol-3-phosphate acyltransferase